VKIKVKKPPGSVPCWLKILEKIYNYKNLTHKKMCVKGKRFEKRKIRKILLRGDVLKVSAPSNISRLFFPFIFP